MTNALDNYRRCEVVGSIPNAVECGMKHEIDQALAAECWRAAVMLIYAGIDAMACLDRPLDKSQAGAAGFKSWCDRYVCPSLPGVSAAALYQARCAMLHSYSATSQRPDCQHITYVAERNGSERDELSVGNDMIIMSVRHLRDAFFAAVDAFLDEVKRDPVRHDKVQEHAQALATALNLNRNYVVIAT